MGGSTVTKPDFRNLQLPEMEEIISRFNERVNAAQQANPPTKDWVKKAIRRQGGRRSPVRLKRLSTDAIIRYGDELADLFCEFPDDVIPVAPYDYTIGYQPPDKKDRVNAVEVMMSDAQWVDEWGTRWGHAHGGVGATTLDYPLDDWSKLDHYLASRMPDPRAAGRLDDAAGQLRIHSATKYCYGTQILGLFERLHCLRGMENVFMDFYTEEACVHRLLDAICGFLIEVARAWSEAGADALFLTDDWGTQMGTMIAPAMWRDIFKPYYKRLFDEVHRCGMDVFLHSCGNVIELVDDFIDVGVDVLDPVQPGAMDAGAVAREFGGRISFSGGIDVQDLMVFGKPQEVRDETLKLIDLLGSRYGNGFVVGPANVMTPDIPMENLRAMFEACHQQ